MGVLQIETRGEKLRNLGNVSGVRVRTGRAEAARTIGNAKAGLIESAGRMGDAVVGLGSQLLKMSVGMDDLDRKTRLDEFAAKYQQEMNAYMLGDGERGSGVINEDFKDGKEWMSKVEDKRLEVQARLRNELGIGDAEWRREGWKLISGFDEQWRARQATHAFQVQEKRSQLSATARTNRIAETLSMGDGTPEMYGDWYSARNNEAISHHAGVRIDRETGALDVYDKPIYEQFMRDGALKLVSTQFANQVKMLSAACAEREDRKEVAKMFDEAGKGWRRDDGGYNFGAFVKDRTVLAALGERGLDGYERQFESDWERAKAQAVNAADNLFRQRKQESRTEVQERLDELAQQWDASDADGVPVSYLTKAQAVRDLARRNNWRKGKDGGKDEVEADGAQYPLAKYDPAGHAALIAKAKNYEVLSARASKLGQVAETKEQAENRKAYENDLSMRVFQYKLASDADFDDEIASMSEDEKDEWYKNRAALMDEYYAANKAGSISVAKAKEIETTFDRNVKAETRSAARDFAEAFGFNREEYSLAGARKDASFRSEQDTPQELGSSRKWYLLGFKSKDYVTGGDFLKLYDGYMDRMAKMPAGVDRAEYTRKCIDEVKRQAADINIEACIDYFGRQADEMTKAKKAQTSVNLLELNKKPDQKKETK